LSYVVGREKVRKYALAEAGVRFDIMSVQRVSREQLNAVSKEIQIPECRPQARVQICLGDRTAA
jgi:hypothetical protein